MALSASCLPGLRLIGSYIEPRAIRAHMARFVLGLILTFHKKTIGMMTYTQSVRIEVAM